VFEGPHHPYTEALLSAVLVLDEAAAGPGGLDGSLAEVSGPARAVQAGPGVTGKGRIRLQGEIPSAAHPPYGCVFHTRCPRKLADGSCESAVPPLREVAPGHFMSCHIPIDQLAVLQRSEGGTQ
jgi:peptide/nickel transport system ATP-binding protein